MRHICNRCEKKLCSLKPSHNQCFAFKHTVLKANIFHMAFYSHGENFANFINRFNIPVSVLK